MRVRVRVRVSVSVGERVRMKVRVIDGRAALDGCLHQPETKA